MKIKDLEPLTRKLLRSTKWLSRTVTFSPVAKIDMLEQVLHPLQKLRWKKTIFVFQRGDLQAPCKFSGGYLGLGCLAWSLHVAFLIDERQYLTDLQRWQATYQKKTASIQQLQPPRPSPSSDWVKIEWKAAAVGWPMWKDIRGHRPGFLVGKCPGGKFGYTSLNCQSFLEVCPHWSTVKQGCYKIAQIILKLIGWKFTGHSSKNIYRPAVILSNVPPALPFQELPIVRGMRYDHKFGRGFLMR